jgi:integrase
MGARGSGRQTAGRLFKRPSGMWALRYVVNGRDIRVSLDTGDAKEAKRRAAGYLHPVQARTEVDRREAATKALQDAADALAQAESQAHRLPLSEVWTRLPYDHSAPGRGSRRALSTLNVEQNRIAWAKFATWATGRLGAAACMEDVTPETAMAYSQWLHDHERVTAGRHNKLLNVARVMYRRAGRPDPFAGVPRYSVRYESRRSLEIEELQRVCGSATGELRTLFAIMLYTGLRLGDAVTLEWSSLIHGRIIRRMAKTGKDVSLTMHPSLAAVLAEIPDACRRGPICPGLAADYRANSSNLSRTIRAHLERCGLTCVEDGPDRRRRVSRLGAHAFRHSFATICARNGVPEGAVQAWLGHWSAAVTRIYQHWGSRETDARILAALPAAPFSAPALPPAAPFSAPALPPAAPEPERAALHRLADAGSIEEVRAALAAAAERGRHESRGA